MLALIESLGYDVHEIVENCAGGPGFGVCRNLLCAPRAAAEMLAGAQVMRALARQGYIRPWHRNVPWERRQRHISSSGRMRSVEV